ncbi:MAG: hypothetical protein II760_05905 [Lachnospiraceae bacterium]|nr:hypothetical protein [Lachnospiraceae bacterium]
MVLLAIDSSKDFMGKLLVSDAFDSFLLQEANIITSVTHTVNGRIHADFYTEEERLSHTGEFIPWSEIRPLIFESVKGKNTPLSLRLTLCLKKEAMDALMQKKNPEAANTGLRALVINIRFESGAVAIMTGTSYDSFVLDRSAEEIWDETVKQFLLSKEISFTAQN